MSLNTISKPVPVAFGFLLEYSGPEPVYDEFEKYLKVEFDHRDPGWDPRFGKVTAFDPKTEDWNYRFVVTGNVPEATTRDEAERKAKVLSRELGVGLKAAHANPGGFLPTPVVQIWLWQPTSEGSVKAAAS